MTGVQTCALPICGPWRLELSEPRAGATAEPGQVIAWDVRATGRGWPGLASAPSLTIYGPDGLPVQTGDGTSYSGTAGNASGCYSGARGAFTARFPGTYIITPEPFRWFDPSAGVLRTALAQAVRVTVAPPPVVAWEAPEYAKDFAVKTLTRLAAADSSWASALDAANRSDWLAARSEAFRASGVGEVKGSLPSATVRGTGAADRASAVAAAGLLAGDRAEAYAAFLRLERTAFPPRGVSSMADIGRLVR